MAVTAELKALIDQMPAPDDRAMFTKGIDKSKIDEATIGLYEGGREAILGLIAMLGMPGSDADVKPRYALRCLSNHILAAKDEAARKQLCEAMADSLQGDLPKHVKACLCEELQWTGGQEAVAALGSLLLDEELVEPATLALLAIRQDVAATFRAALPGARGKSRLNLIQALGDLQDHDARGILQDAIQDADHEIRLAAGWGLARLGHADSARWLLAEADAREGWERIQATKHCLMLAEQLAAAGRQDAAQRIYAHFVATRTGPEEQYVQRAAQRALRKD